MRQRTYAITLIRYKAGMVILQLEKLLNGRSHYWLAKQTGLAHTTIGRLPKATKISYLTLDKLCEAFHCEVADLFSRETQSGQAVYHRPR